MTCRSVVAFSIVAVLVKAAIIVLLIGDPPTAGPYGRWCSVLGDTGSYLEPAENLFSHGHYTPDFRMPGYGAAYMACRLFVPMDQAGNALVFLQTLLDALSTVVLALLALRLTRSTVVFHGVFWCSLLGHTVSQFDITLLTESFTTSAIIFSVFLTQGSPHTRRTGMLLIAGAFCGWAIFMRPVTFIVLPALGIWLAISSRGSRDALRNVVLLAMPFTLFEVAWVTRNALVHGRFIPANTSFHYTSIDEGPIGPVIAFVEAFGGRTTWWDPEAEIRFFGLDGGVEPGRRTTLPPEVITPGCSLDSLQRVADDLAHWRQLPSDDVSRVNLGRSIGERMRRYRAAYIDAHPWRYALIAPLRCTRAFLVHSGTENVFGRPWSALMPWQRLLKAAWSILFHLFQAGGLAACVLALLLGDLRARIGWFAALVMLAALLHPLVFRMTEHRYLAPVFPWLILIGWVVWGLLAHRMMESRKG